MALQSLQEINLDHEKKIIDQTYGPILDSAVKELVPEEYRELERLNEKFVKARRDYLDSLVMLKIMTIPLILMFFASLLRVLAAGEFGWGFAVVPILYAGLLGYRFWRGFNLANEQKSFVRLVHRIDEDQSLNGKEFQGKWEVQNLSETGQLTLDNAIRSIALTRKAVSVKKRSSLMMGLISGLVIGLVLSLIGFLLTNVLGFFDPAYDSFLEFLSVLIWVMGFGILALPYTDYNNLMYQFSGLISDYCHYRDLCYYFRVTDTEDFDRRFVAEMAEPSVFSSIPPKIVLNEIRGWWSS